MKKTDQTGIVIQARMGSSRLPGKMGLEFYKGQSLMDIVLDRLHSLTQMLPMIVATTEKNADDFIEEISKKKGVPVFRGSEEDVLARFIGAAEQFDLNYIIRICADNPFIQPRFVQQLKNYNKDSIADYVGFRLNRKIPAIKTHLGLFPELVKVQALKSIDNPELTQAYREHVTNYFYSDENQAFSTKWIDQTYPEDVLTNIRLTIDTGEDFVIASRIYRYFREHSLDSTDENIIRYVYENTELIESMSRRIKQNEK